MITRLVNSTAQVQRRWQPTDPVKPVGLLHTHYYNKRFIDHVGADDWYVTNYKGTRYECADTREKLIELVLADYKYVVLEFDTEQELHDWIKASI